MLCAHAYAYAMNRNLNPTSPRYRSDFTCPHQWPSIKFTQVNGIGIGMKPRKTCSNFISIINPKTGALQTNSLLLFSFNFALFFSSFSGYDRSHHVNFYYSLESAATGAATAGWFGRYSTLPPRFSCAAILILNLDGARRENLKNCVPRLANPFKFGAKGYFFAQHSEQRSTTRSTAIKNLCL